MNDTDGTRSDGTGPVRGLVLDISAFGDGLGLGGCLPAIQASGNATPAVAEDLLYVLLVHLKRASLDQLNESLGSYLYQCCRQVRKSCTKSHIRITLVGALGCGGEGVCNPIYVDKLSQQIVSIIRHPEAVNGCFNEADDELTNWPKYFSTLARELGLDFGKLGQVPARPYRPSLSNRFGDFKQSAPARWLKQQFNRTAKLRLKTPLPNSGLVPAPQPELMRGAWHQQNVRHKLSNRKFRDTFDRHDKVSFTMAMPRCGEWIRFSGFADR